MDSFKAKCRKHNLRLTPQRIMIYKELQMASDHPPAEVLYERLKKKLPGISFDTVYRTLATYVEMGLIEQMNSFGTAMRFDCNPDNHHHFHCRQCGNVIDFINEDYKRIPLPDTIANTCDIHKLHIILEGLCSQCKMTEKT